MLHQTGISQEQISVISRFAMASIGSQGTVGGLVVAGFVSVKVFFQCDRLFTNTTLSTIFVVLCDYSCWRPLDGAYWLALAHFMAVYTSTSDSHGIIPLKNGNSKVSVVNTASFCFNAMNLFSFSFFTQRAIRASCDKKVEIDRRFDIIELQSSSATVIIFLNFIPIWSIENFN